MSLKDKFYQLAYIGKRFIFGNVEHEVVAYNIGERTFDIVDENGMRSEWEVYEVLYAIREQEASK